MMSMVRKNMKMDVLNDLNVFAEYSDVVKNILDDLSGVVIQVNSTAAHPHCILTRKETMVHEPYCEMHVVECQRRYGILHIPMTMCLVHVLEGWCTPCHRRCGVLHIPMTLCLAHVMEG